ncbi:cytochrome P450 [Dermatophilus congolensis]|uniref:cytochrome P450 n=1 Tax=Dermatophilus congolensis TaxID=1863 RepID=UPI001DDAB854|nr:cytochrome P450 [Dermatophilus congolensis]MBO3169872.1 cytochrome P450 [Dermatophilus congolensis]
MAVTGAVGVSLGASLGEAGCPMHAYLDAHVPDVGSGLGGFVRVSDPVLVREVLGRADDFGPENALTAMVPLCPEALRVLAGVGFALPPVLASASGAAHRLVRGVVAGFVSPRRVDGVVPRAQALADEALGGVREVVDSGAVVDLSVALTRRVAAPVFTELTGMPMPEPVSLRRWSQDSLELFWGFPDRERQVELAVSAAELFAWLRDAIEVRTGSRTVFDALREAGVDARRRASLAFFLVIGGQETTAMLGDIALYSAVRSGGLWARLGGADEVTAQAAAREHVRSLLATTSSVAAWRRQAVRDTTLAGRCIPAGTQLLVELSGHHVDVQAAVRGTGYGLAFGFGVHRCLGARLAEVEASLIVRRAAVALPDVVPVGPDARWWRLSSFQAPDAVRVGVAGVGL